MQTNNETIIYMLDEKKAAELLDLSPRTLQNWRGIGKGPQYVKLFKKSVRYRLEDIKEWIEKNVRRSTSDQGENKNDN